VAPGFRPPRWLLLCTVGLVFGAFSNSAQAQVPGEQIGADGAPVVAPREMPPRPRLLDHAVGEDHRMSGEVLVEIAGQPSSQQLETLAARHSLVHLQSHTISLTNSTWSRWRIGDDRSVATVVRALAAEQWIRSAQPNYRFMLE
jgi:hypothetical protein